mmetsp:Transcript_8581/g.14900  ORF Transcript_8581/g.14900 Transcript_8581/m.14900 type:complete len:207 (+) Transcript_8581:376-996(+)
MRLAISVARGRILPNVSKDSVRKICIPPTRSSGRNTIATTMIPIPPSHCRIPRHSNRPLGKFSSPERTVEPVVVSPDIASKNASTKRASVAPKKKGSAPKTGRASQTPVVNKKVCWIVRPSRTPFAQLSAMAPPVSTVITAHSAKMGQCPRPSAKSTSMGRIMAMPSTATSRPITYPTGRRSNMTPALKGRLARVKQLAACGVRSL